MTLFIGGPLDGEERDLGERSYYDFVERIAETRYYTTGQVAFDAAHTHHGRYLRYRVYGCDFAMLDTAVVPDDLMKILLAAYPRKR